MKKERINESWSCHLNLIFYMHSTNQFRLGQKEKYIHSENGQS